MIHFSDVNSPSFDFITLTNLENQSIDLMPSIIKIQRINEYIQLGFGNKAFHMSPSIEGHKFSYTKVI